MLLPLHLFALLATVQAACYFPDGRLSPNDTPCRDDTDHAVCCGQGYACLTNGLCQATGDELQKPDASEYVRGGCTDKTFRSSSCPAVCIDPDLDNVAGGHGLGKCEGTSRDMYYCISSGREVNCTSGEGVVFFAGQPSVITTIGVVESTSTTSESSTLMTNTKDTTTSSSTSSSSTDSTATSSDSTTPVATPAKGTSPQDENPPEDEPSNDSSPSKAVIIGGAVGGGAALLILAGLGWWFWKKRRNATQVEQGSRYNEATYEHHAPNKDPGVAGRVEGLYEAPGTGVVHQGPFEVYGSEGAWKKQKRHEAPPLW